MPDAPPSKARPHPLRCEPSVARTKAGASSRYAELDVTSNYTFLTGASHPEEYVVRAAELGVEAVAITDTNSLAGVVRAHVAAKDAGVQLVVGSRLVLREPVGLQLLVYPFSRAGYANLCKVLTLGKRRAIKGRCDLTLRDVIDHNEGLLGVFVPPREMSSEAARDLCALREVFDDDRLSIAFRREFGPDDRSAMRDTARLSRELCVPLAANNAVLYHGAERRALQDVLTAIRHGVSVESAGFQLRPNCERCLKPPDEVLRIIGDGDALARSVDIAARARGFSLDQIRYEYPHEVTPPGVSSIEHLRSLAWSGANERYPDGVPARVRGAITHELSLIDELAYAPYFLTVHDLVRYARSRGILCQGRGAAANSAVCYCLGVTPVDPGRIDLLFERFVSRERNEPPDIDIDFEHERREEVIQYIYRKYGRERAALTAEVISYRGRSAVREVGKALGLSLDTVDRLSKSLDWWDSGQIDAERMRQIGINPEDRTIKLLVHLCGQIRGFPRHLSQHVGGFVITNSPLCELVPIENAAMPDRTVIEWDKDDIDAMGMLKVDCLGLGMLTCVRKCFDLIEKARDEKTKRQRDEETKGQRNKEEEGRRDGETEGQSEEIHRMEKALFDAGGLSAVELVSANEEQIQGERSYVVDQDIPRPDCLATEQRSRGGDLQDHRVIPEVRDVRLNESDASRRGVSPVEYRGGLREENSRGVPPRAEHRGRLTRGTLDPDGNRGDSRIAGEHHGCSGSVATDRPIAQRADPQTQGNGGLIEPHGAERTPRPGTSSQSISTLSPCHPVPLSLASIPPEDPAVYYMLCKGDSVGVFQVESRAQMAMLPRLRPRCFYDLVVEVAIVRPGPIQGKMVHPYLRRRNGEEDVTYPSEAVRSVLGRTLGVPLFQEQAMKLAIVAAGFTPGEADQLRRAMAAWKRKGDAIYRFGQKLIAGLIANGYTPEFADRCFEQIKGFSEYGFPESHAASFALIVYVSAWLKCHYPAAFAAALINSQPMGFYQPAQIVRDAQEHGVEARVIDVNASNWDCTLEDGGRAIRLGMRLVKGLSQAHADAISAARDQHGPFASLAQIQRRAGIPVAAIRRLARGDALRSLGLDRQQALWEAQALRDDSLPLFDGADSPVEPAGALPVVDAVNIVRDDYANTGLSLKAHPVSFVRPYLDSIGVTPAASLRDARAFPNGKRVKVAGLVLVRQRPGTASGVVFFTLEDETGVANLIVWPKTYEKYRAAARHAPMILATGRVERAGEVVHVQPTRIEAVTAGDVSMKSRDFH